MHPGDIDSFPGTVAINGQPTSFSDGSIILGNLVTFHQVRVKVVLTVEFGIFGDGAI